MFAEERQQKIAELVAGNGRVSVTLLAERFRITTETVRRDLAALENAGTVRRVHGGEEGIGQHAPVGLLPAADVHLGQPLYVRGNSPPNGQAGCHGR